MPGTRRTTLGLACITPSGQQQPTYLARELIEAGATVDWQGTWARCGFSVYVLVDGLWGRRKGHQPCAVTMHLLYQNTKLHMCPQSATYQLLPAGQHGETALHECIGLLTAAAQCSALPNSYKHILGCTMFLLEQGANVNLRSKCSDKTLLMRVVGQPQPLGLQLTTALLLFSPELGAIDGQGQTALNHAIAADNFGAVALLRAAGANLSPPLPRVMALTKGFVTPLQQAAGLGHTDAAKLLIHFGADVNAFPPVLSEETRLQRWANTLGVDEGDYDVFGRISRKMPPLMHAIAEGHAEMVRLLLNSGADVDKTGGQEVAKCMGTARWHDRWQQS